MIKKILVIGNAAGGKTVLSRRLQQIHQLPLTHVDSLQFLPGLCFRPHAETLKKLEEIAQQKEWIIDGFGPLDRLEQRLLKADQIILIYWPLWKHHWWFFKRQMLHIFSQRQELPPDCHEFTWKHTLKVIDNIKKVHFLMRPELLRILQRPNIKNKVIIIRDKNSWAQIYKNGLGAQAGLF